MTGDAGDDDARSRAWGRARPPDWDDAVDQHEADVAAADDAIEVPKVVARLPRRHDVSAAQAIAAAVVLVALIVGLVLGLAATH